MRRTVGDDARGFDARGAIRLVVEDSVDAALLVAVSWYGTASRTTALATSKRAADIAVVVRAADASEAVAARAAYSRR